MKKPSTFVEWRNIYHSETKMLGWDVYYKFNGRTIEIDRELWKRLNRIKRIKKRLEVENAVMDRTWCEELIKLIWKRKG